MNVMYVLTTLIFDDGDDATVEEIKKMSKWENDDYVCRGIILNDFKHTLKHKNEELNLVELDNHLRIKESLRGKRKHHDNARADPNKKAKPTCWKCGKTGHIKRDCKGATIHVCKDRCWFKTYKSLNDGFILHMGNESIALMHGHGCVDLRLGHVHFKRMQDMSKDGLISAFDMDTEKPCYLLNKRNKITLYELWTKKKPNLNYRRVWGCKAVVRLPDPKQKTLGERGIECIFVGYVEHYKASRTKDGVSNQHSYRFNVEDDPKTFDEAMKSQDVALWKDGINDEMDSIMGNNTWVLADIPSVCQPLGCKWIFKRKLKVDGTIEKFKARLVIQGFRKRLGIDYFDTYAPLVRISAIRILIAMASIHNLIIHQMNVKTTFFNDELDEEVYLTKKFLSSRFSVKDMNEADVIFGIKIKHESNRIAISQSHYIKKELKKFNYFECTHVSTPMDKREKLVPNNGQVVSQLEYSIVIGCLIYAMTYTKPYIAFAVAVSKEAEWLKNLLLEILLWDKPIASIFIRCDSVATLAKAYSQMYNGKS
nr:zinc finger, CCHC-type [Tanacetum cinerariifolium]GEY08892.1 zinc finger, CCHC-type [Tanacetum cinerariifolium]